MEMIKSEIKVEYIDEFVSKVIAIESLDRREIQRIKTILSSKYGFREIPKNSEILSYIIYNRGRYDERYGQKKIDAVIKILVKKPMRTASGVAPVAIMTPPHRCPHGRCVYCPGGVDSNTPQSYTGKEPAALRASTNDYDAYKQVRQRLEQYRAIGHPIDKVDLIIMGGTFLAMPAQFQASFLRDAYNALNSWGKMAKCLFEAKMLNEHGTSRCIGLTIETRPDWCFESHVNMVLALGGTRVELGVQCIDNNILRLVKRGHTVEDTIKATRILKDAGLKVCYHIMLNLPSSTPEKDISMAERIFSDERFMPDMLKIYPTLVIEDTELYSWWLKGEYKPYGFEELVDTIAKIKSIVPEWVRIQRIQRDIPSGLIIDGGRRSNLRQIVRRRMQELGLRCRCIRCREVGHRGILPMETWDIRIKTTEYKASGSDEIFISAVYTESDTIAGYLRLRIPSKKVWRSEIRKYDAAIVRELRVVGPMVPISHSDIRYDGIQHRGLGQRMLSLAEDIAANKYDKRYLAVTSGVGVRGYYRRLGYELKGVYMVKRIRN